MLTFANCVLAACMAVGLAEEPAEEKPEYDPNLEPIARLIGEWTSEQKTATGELRQTVKTTYAWRANGKAMLAEISATKPDGDEVGRLCTRFGQYGKERPRRY